MLDQMSSISGSFNEELVNAVLEGKRFRIVGDNVNFHIDVAQERSVGKKAHIEHWFGSAAIIQHVSFNHLPNVTPQKDLREIACESFILTTDEMNLIVQDFTMHSAEILTEHFHWLEFAKSAVTESVNELPEGMDQRNKVIPLPVLHKNEQKYADVVEVLDSYQDICETVYRSAEKPLPKVHIGGDQLTRERFSGAKKLRAAGLTESERLANLQPITFELFHLQMAVLTAFYQILYDTQNTEPFTLYCQKVRLMRKQADGKDVKNHYDSCKDLAESFIKAYIVEAACEHIGLPDTTVVPDNIPDHSNMSSEEIRVWVSEQFTPIFDIVTSVTREFLNGAGIQQNIADSINTYAKLVVELGLIYMELCNIVKRPNRDKLLRLMKYIMLVLKGHNNRSKYALEILRLLCQQFALLSEQCAHETIYGLFVNTGKSIIPADLQMEYLVRLTKTHLRAMCSNVTETSLKKRSSAFFGMNEISEHFDVETSTVKRAQKHKKLSSLEDEKKVLRCLRVIRPFVTVTGREIKSQKKDPKNPIAKLNIEDLKGWLEKHKVNFYYEL